MQRFACWRAKVGRGGKRYVKMHAKRASEENRRFVETSGPSHGANAVHTHETLIRHRASGTCPVQRPLNENPGPKPSPGKTHIFKHRFLSGFSLPKWTELGPKWELKTSKNLSKSQPPTTHTENILLGMIFLEFGALGTLKPLFISHVSPESIKKVTRNQKNLMKNSMRLLWS